MTPPIPDDSLAPTLAYTNIQEDNGSETPIGEYSMLLAEEGKLYGSDDVLDESESVGSDALKDIDDADTSTDKGKEKGNEKGGIHWIYPFMNLWKTYVASGIIALPYAFAKGGFAITATMLIWNAFLNNVTMRMVFSLKIRLDANSYEDIAYKIGGWSSKAITVFGIVCSEIGFCAAYTVFIVDTLHQMHSGISIYLYVLMIFVPIWLLCQIPSLERLGFVAVVGNFAMVSIIIIVLVYGFSHDTSTSGKHYKSYDLSNTAYVFGIAVYTFAIQAVCIPNSHNVRKVEKVYPRILDATALIAGLQCTLFGWAGYYFFGEDTGDMITKNLPHGVFTDMTKICLVVVLTATFPLQMFVPSQVIESYIAKKGSRLRWLRRFVSRTVLVALTMGLAVFLPFFADLLSLVGCLSCSLIAFLLPAVFYFRVFRNELSVAKTFSIALIFFFGLVGMVVGVTQDVAGLAEKLSKLYS